MSDNPQNEYLKAKIMTATPQQLQTMLYDGAIRFCEQARVAMEDKNIAEIHERIVRAQRIVIELIGSLKVEIEPEICSKMASLYNYIYRLLIDANLNRDIEKLDEAIKLLQHIRETWKMAVEQARKENSSANMADFAGQLPDMQEKSPNQQPATASARPAQSTTGSILSVEG